MSKIAELAEMLHDAKSGPCADCGVQYPIHVMQLDHRPGSGKRFHVSDPLWGKPSPGLDAAAVELGSVVAALRAEIAKCDLVCANCHAERTFRRGLARRIKVQPSWCRHYRDLGADGLKNDRHSPLTTDPVFQLVDRKEK